MKKYIFYCFAWNLAWSFKVSFTKYRTLHCAVLELPKLLMDSGGLDTARKDLPRQRKAENYLLGEGTHHQQHPHAAPRRSFSCCLLLKRSSAAILQRMGLRKCTTAVSRVGEQRIWNCVPIPSGEALSSSWANCLPLWAVLATAGDVSQGSLPWESGNIARDPPFPLQDRWVNSGSSSQVSDITTHCPPAKWGRTVTSPESWHACSRELSGSRITPLTIWFRSMRHRKSQVFPHKIFWKEERNIFHFLHSFGRKFPATCLKTSKPQSRKHSASGYFQCFQIILSVWVLCFEVAENQTV